MKTHSLHCEVRLAPPPEELFEFFADPENLERITPDWLSFRVLHSSTERLGEGTEIDYALRLRGLPLRWRSRISVWEPPSRFVDEQVRGPYRRWRHVHSFERDPAGGTQVRDWVEYALPGGALLAGLANRLFVRGDVERIFEHRTRVLEELFGPPDSDARQGTEA